jgi:hypothetical protein
MKGYKPFHPNKGYKRFIRRQERGKYKDFLKKHKQELLFRGRVIGFFHFNIFGRSEGECYNWFCKGLSYILFPFKTLATWYSRRFGVSWDIYRDVLWVKGIPFSNSFLKALGSATKAKRHKPYMKIVLLEARHTDIKCLDASFLCEGKEEIVVEFLELNEHLLTGFKEKKRHCGFRGFCPAIVATKNWREPITIEEITTEQKKGKKIERRKEKRFTRKELRRFLGKIKRNRP